jgi:hypothetical protein
MHFFLYHLLILLTFEWIFLLYSLQAPEFEDKGSLFVLTGFCIPSDPFSLLLSLFIRTYFLDTFTPLCYLHCKKIRNFTLGLATSGAH